MIPRRDLDIMAVLHQDPPLARRLLGIPWLLLQAAEPPLADKTLVAWVSPANLNQRADSVLAIDDGRYDLLTGNLLVLDKMGGVAIRRPERSGLTLAISGLSPGIPNTIRSAAFALIPARTFGLSGLPGQ